MKTRKKWSVVLSAILILAITGGLVYRFVFYDPSGSTASSTQKYQSYTVTASDIALSVQGSGDVEAGKSEDVSVAYAGSVLSINVEDGDRVKSGDILATYELTGLENEVNQLRADLASADANLERLDPTNGTTAIKSPVKGLVKVIHISANDLIDAAMEKYGSLMVISVDKKMTVTVNPTRMNGLETGQAVTITIGSKSVDGRIREIMSDGAVVVLFNDNGYDVEADAVVKVADGTILGTGKTAVNQPFLVTSTGGIVNYLSTSAGKSVSVGTTLLRIKEQVLTPAYLQALKNREALQTELSEKLKLSKIQTITATSDGIVSGLTIKAGDDLKAGQAVCTMIDDSILELTLDIDELDIPSIAVGQTAKVTLDALGDKTYEAKVTRISAIGAYSGGVATYPVTLTINTPTGILAGMSANATIVVSSSANVPVIPLAALQTIGNRKFVLNASALNSDGTLITAASTPTTITSETSTPTNMGGQSGSPLQPYLIEVIVGLSAENGVEIISGISIGDKIAIAVSSGTGQPTGLNLGGLSGMGGIQGGTRPSGQINPGTRPSGR